MLYEVLRSLIYHGFKRLIVINGHRMANLPPLQIAATRIRNETGAYVTIADPFYLADTVSREIKESPPGAIGHAEELETSHMMHIFPDLVNLKKAVKNLPRKKKFHVARPLRAGRPRLHPVFPGKLPKSHGTQRGHRRPDPLHGGKGESSSTRRSWTTWWN